MAISNFFRLCTFAGLLFLLSCSPKVRTTLADTSIEPLAASEDIFVVRDNSQIPESSKFIGNLRIGDTGFSTKCNYEIVMAEAKLSARNSGANFILLNRVRQPGFSSTCYRIDAELYRNLDRKERLAAKAKSKELNKSQLPEDADYAVVYFYRPKNYSGSLISYKIRIEPDSVIGKMKNNSKFQYPTRDFGPTVFWCKTESVDQVEIDVKPGEEYYVRARIKMGALVGRPEIEVVSNYRGREEYQAVD